MLSNLVDMYTCSSLSPGSTTCLGSQIGVELGEKVGLGGLSTVLGAVAVSADFGCALLVAGRREGVVRSVWMEGKVGFLRDVEG